MAAFLTLVSIRGFGAILALIYLSIAATRFDPSLLRDIALIVSLWGFHVAFSVAGWQVPIAKAQANPRFVRRSTLKYSIGFSVVYFVTLDPYSAAWAAMIGIILTDIQVLQLFSRASGGWRLGAMLIGARWIPPIILISLPIPVGHILAIVVIWIAFPRPQPNQIHPCSNPHRKTQLSHIFLSNADIIGLSVCDPQVTVEILIFRRALSIVLQFADIARFTLLFAESTPIRKQQSTAIILITTVCAAIWGAVLCNGMLPINALQTVITFSIALIGQNQFMRAVSDGAEPRQSITVSMIFFAVFGSILAAQFGPEWVVVGHAVATGAYIICTRPRRT